MLLGLHLVARIDPVHVKRKMIINMSGEGVSQTENSKSVASYKKLCIPICSIAELFVVTENIYVECRLSGEYDRLAYEISVMETQNCRWVQSYESINLYITFLEIIKEIKLQLQC